MPKSKRRAGNIRVSLGQEGKQCCPVPPPIVGQAWLCHGSITSCKVSRLCTGICAVYGAGRQGIWQGSLPVCTAPNEAEGGEAEAPGAELGPDGVTTDKQHWAEGSSCSLTRTDRNLSPHRFLHPPLSVQCRSL